MEKRSVFWSIVADERRSAEERRGEERRGEERPCDDVV
jgi:hypothetical protein